MFADPFENAASSLVAPSSDCFEITPDDNADLARAAKAIYVGTGGDLVVRLVKSDSDVTFRNVISGSILDLRVRAVRQAGTTAADVVGLA